MGQRCCPFLTSSPIYQPVTCPGSAGNQQRGQRIPPPAKHPWTREPRHCRPAPPNATPRCPTPPKVPGAAARALLQVSQPSPAFYLCNLGDTRELAKSCQGDPFMQRLHFGPSKEKEMSRQQGVPEAERHRLQPPTRHPCGVHATMLGNSVLQNLLGLVSKQRLNFSSHLCSS